MPGLLARRPIRSWTWTSTATCPRGQPRLSEGPPLGRHSRQWPVAWAESGSAPSPAPASRGPANGGTTLSGSELRPPAPPFPRARRPPGTPPPATSRASPRTQRLCQARTQPTSSCAALARPLPRWWLWLQGVSSPTAEPSPRSTALSQAPTTSSCCLPARQPGSCARRRAESTVRASDRSRACYPPHRPSASRAMAGPPPAGRAGCPLPLPRSHRRSFARLRLPAQPTPAPPAPWCARSQAWRHGCPRRPAARYPVSLFVPLCRQGRLSLSPPAAPLASRAGRWLLLRRLCASLGLRPSLLPARRHTPRGCLPSRPRRRLRPGRIQSALPPQSRTCLPSPGTFKTTPPCGQPGFGARRRAPRLTWS